MTLISELLMCAKEQGFYPESLEGFGWFSDIININKFLLFLIEITAIADADNYEEMIK